MSENINIQELETKIENIQNEEESLKNKINKLIFQRESINSSLEKEKEEIKNKYNVTSLNQLKSLLEEKIKDLKEELKSIDISIIENKKIVNEINEQLEKISK